MQFNELMNDNFVIPGYSRAQAIEDGYIVDVTQVAQEAGIKYPVALSRTVWDKYIVPDERALPYGQSEQGRLWDLLWMFRTAALRTSGPYLKFKCYFIMGEKQRWLVEFKSICGPGDTAEPVITIMMPDED